LMDFKVPVEIVERASGLELFHLPRNQGRSVGDLCDQVECQVTRRKFKEATNSQRGRGQLPVVT